MYFTAVPLSSAANGGNIGCRNHVLRLNQDEQIDLRVAAAVMPEDFQGTKDFLEASNVEHLIVARRTDNVHQEEMGTLGAIKFGLKAATHFHWELASLNQSHIDEAITYWATTHWKVDVVVIDYLYSALFCRSLLGSSTKKALITDNREQEYYRSLLRFGLIKHDWLTGEISARRLGRFEKKTYMSCDMVIAIGENDLPPYLPVERKRCIIPYLDESSRWSFGNSPSFFYVGNIGHYPNRTAIEFIAKKLAPSVAQRRPDVRFKIVGAAAADVPADWRHPQVDYLGIADAETVSVLFTTSNALICPIENTFGMKFKVAEAVSHGTPIVANRETLQCIPYIPGLPAFDLSDPSGAADILCALADNGTELTRLSDLITTKARSFVRSQEHVWSQTLRSIVHPLDPKVLVGSSAAAAPV
jgi:glycosyltransferase involved in cell wall biosynthesis